MASVTPDVLGALTPLFRYPGEGYAACAAELAERFDDDDLRAFAAAMAGLLPAARQEAFVQAFDLNPAAALEIGWHLFGERHERGAFLVDLRQLLREAGIAETGELPDHLLHVLPLVANMASQDAEAFVVRCLAPALDKIAAALSTGSPFVLLLRATRAAVTGHGPEAGSCHD